MSDDTGATPHLEDWQRPLPDQVASVRHRVGNVEQQYVLLHNAVKQMGDRMNLFEAQVAALAMTPEAMAAVVDDALNRRAEAARAERKEDIKAVFSRSKAAALYIIAIGQAILMLVGLYALLFGNPF